MSLFLNRVVQADCPACKNTLRIPANWLSEPIRCKHCGLVFQAKTAKRRNLFRKALNAVSHLGGRMPSKQKKDPVPPSVPTAMPVAAAAGRAVPTAAVASRRRPKRRGSTWIKLAFVMIFLLGVGSLVAVVHHLSPHLFEADNAESKAPVARGTANDKTTGVQTASPSSRSTAGSGRREVAEFVGPPEPTPVAGKNPRRLLGIGISNYPYANPLNSGGTGPKAFPQVMQYLADILRVPSDQVNVLSDRGPGAVLPTRAVLYYALASFLSASRPMDRIVVVFAGHAVEQGGSVYLLPLLGEAGEPQSLLPLDDLYRMLARPGKTADPGRVPLRQAARRRARHGGAHERGVRGGAAQAAAQRAGPERLCRRAIFLGDRSTGTRSGGERFPECHRPDPARRRPGRCRSARPDRAAAGRRAAEGTPAPDRPEGPRLPEQEQGREGKPDAPALRSAARPHRDLRSQAAAAAASGHHAASPGSRVRRRHRHGCRCRPDPGFRQPHPAHQAGRQDHAAAVRRAAALRQGEAGRLQG